MGGAYREASAPPTFTALRPRMPPIIPTSGGRIWQAGYHYQFISKMSNRLQVSEGDWTCSDPRYLILSFNMTYLLLLENITFLTSVFS